MIGEEGNSTKFHSVFPTYVLLIFWNMHIICMTTTAFSMGTKFVNKEEIVSGTRIEDLFALRLSSLRVSTGKCIVFA